jgi:hypothetical protein
VKFRTVVTPKIDCKLLKGFSFGRNTQKSPDFPRRRRKSQILEAKNNLPQAAGATRMIFRHL